MADHEQLIRLKSGTEIWNEWRSTCPRTKINLRLANLSGAHLSGANLSRININRANLDGADLSGADLSGTNLIRAHLMIANLSGANLSEAYLDEAYLRGANLSGANLSKANLSKADLGRADLSGTNLSGINLSGTNLSGTNLSGQDLSNRNLSGANLSGANLSGANLSGADLHRVLLSGANLSGANLSGTDLSGANLSGVLLSGADLSGANLSSQDLNHKNLSGTNLSEANLSRTQLIGTNFTEAILTNCNIYGIAAWNVRLDRAVQKNLIITQEHEATITIDNLKVAQFVYLLINNQEIRDVLDTIAKKAVLILGRFTSKRKGILDDLREVLRTKGYLPILFDFQGPTSQDVIGTVNTLAHISRFVIADLTDPSCSPYEIGLIAPCRKPITPIFQPSEKEPHAFSMLKDLRKRYPWILPTYEYTSLENLLTSLQEKVIDPAEEKVKELERE